MENYVTLSLDKYQELYSKAKAYDDFISKNKDFIINEFKSISECLKQITNEESEEEIQ